MQWGLGPSKRRRPVLQSGEWLGGPKELEDPAQMQRGPLWSHIREGLCATPTWPPWSQDHTGYGTKVARASVLPKWRRPLPQCGGRPGGPKAAKPPTKGGGLLSGPHVGEDPSSTWWGPRWSSAVGGAVPMRRGRGPSKRRRPPLQRGGRLADRKEVEAPTPMPKGPRWSNIHGGLCGTRAGSPWSQSGEGPGTKVARGFVVPKWRRPPPQCSGHVGGPNAVEAALPRRRGPKWLQSGARSLIKVVGVSMVASRGRPTHHAACPRPFNTTEAPAPKPQGPQASQSGKAPCPKAAGLNGAPWLVRNPREPLHQTSEWFQVRGDPATMRGGGGGGVPAIRGGVCTKPAGPQWPRKAPLRSQRGGGPNPHAAGTAGPKSTKACEPN